MKIPLDAELVIGDERIPVKCTAEAHWSPGYPETRDPPQPAEKAGYVISDVYVEIDGVETSVMNELSENTLIEIQEWAEDLDQFTRKEEQV